MSARLIPQFATILGPSDERDAILGPSDERDAVHSLRARVQRVAEQIAAGDGSDTTHERFVRLVDEHGRAVRARTAARYERLAFELEHPGQAHALAARLVAEAG